MTGCDIPDDDRDGGELAFPCPRCRHETTARFYGPCHDCRMQLRQQLSGEATELEVAEYEPKMNVTPNAVATKD
jgi:hypothetical protein